MRIAEIIFSAIIAAAIVYIVFDKQRVVPEKLVSRSDNFTVEFTTIPQAPPDTLVRIPVTITGTKSEGVKFFLRYSKPTIRDIKNLHRYGASPLNAVDSAAGLYEASIRSGAIGSESNYYFEIRGPAGRNLGGLDAGNKNPFTTKVVGKVESWVKYGYYLGIAAAVFLISLGAAGSLRFFSNKSQSEVRLTQFLIGAIFVLLAGLFLATLLRMQLTGLTWLGAPFGNSLPDNLVQILFVYVLFTYLMSLTVQTKSGRAGTIGSRTLLGYMGVGAFFVMMLAFLIPVLVTGEVAFISIVFYAVTLALVLLLLLSYRNTRNA